MKCYGVIMAGGDGTRFWPLSRRNMPKQLINLTGNDLLINETIDRLNRIIGLDDIFIVTNRDQAQNTLKATNGRILENHILVEPCARNTCACIGYAAVEILEKYGDGIMLVLPADAYIKDINTYIERLRVALEAAEKQDKLITIGVKPYFPSTGYGYIRFDCEYMEQYKPVIEFKEKPSEKKAVEYIETGEYLWNCGIFLWRASTILNKIKIYAPDIYEKLNILSEALGTEKEEFTKEKIYPQIRKISIDYAVMEAASANDDVLVVPGDFGWSDIGSWDMLHTINKPNDEKNVFVGDVLAIDTENSIVYAKNKMIALLGIKDTIVVENDDAILVCARNKAQSIKQICEALETSKRIDLL